MTGDYRVVVMEREDGVWQQKEVVFRGEQQYLRTFLEYGNQGPWCHRCKTQRNL